MNRQITFIREVEFGRLAMKINGDLSRYENRSLPYRAEKKGAARRSGEEMYKDHRRLSSSPFYKRGRTLPALHGEAHTSF